jgi:hypothetical protein
MHPCEKCGAPIENMYRVCYLCMRDMKDALEKSRGTTYELQKGPKDAQTGVNPYYTTPRYENAVERKETTQDARQEAIAKAHQENLEANRELIAAIVYLADCIKGVPHEELNPMFFAKGGKA